MTPSDWGTYDLTDPNLYRSSPASDLERKRLSRPDLFMQVAELFGRRSSCPRANVGAIAVLEGRIVASGYVGAPHGQAHCADVGCLMENGHCVRSVHAEANLVAWAARLGLPLFGTTVWCTHAACRACAKLLANAGIKHFIYNHPYHADALVLLEQMGVRTYEFSKYPEEWA